MALIDIDYDPNNACTDCRACAGICPVHLDPRHLGEPIESPDGLAFSGLRRHPLR
jgi:Na+-translocating ferredoxin:NAD+ oxidoreductase RnfC subunit